MMGVALLQTVSVPDGFHTFYSLVAVRGADFSLGVLPAGYAVAR